MMIVLNNLPVLLVLIMLLLPGLAGVLVVLIARHAAESMALLQLFSHSAVGVNCASRGNRVMMIDTRLRQDVWVLTIEKVRMLVLHIS